MHGLKLSFMTSSLKSGYHKWMPHYILALAFSIASQTLELSPIVPQKKCVPQDILVGFFSIVPVLLFKISEYLIREFHQLEKAKLGHRSVWQSKCAKYFCG